MICIFQAVQTWSSYLMDFWGWVEMIYGMLQFSPVQFSHSAMSDSLWPHESQHARPPCPSPTPGVHSDSRPLSWWCHPAISSSVIPFSFCLQSLPASESFPMSQLFIWGGQSTGISAFYWDIEWFALETNRDHSVVFEIASKSCILDSFVDHDGYSISSKGFLPAVVDIMVIWVKFTHSSPF